MLWLNISQPISISNALFIVLKKRTFKQQGVVIWEIDQWQPEAPCGDNTSLGRAKKYFQCLLLPIFLLSQALFFEMNTKMSHCSVMGYYSGLNRTMLEVSSLIAETFTITYCIWSEKGLMCLYCILRSVTDTPSHSGEVLMFHFNRLFEEQQLQWFNFEPNKLWNIKASPQANIKGDELPVLWMWATPNKGMTYGLGEMEDTSELLKKNGWFVFTDELTKNVWIEFVKLFMFVIFALRSTRIT